ncbi:MAG: type IV pilus assembly protein PilM [Patescibacteria group bacterium]|jgi:type IV pilus assembly protein PilM|nr:type IV pilus assembly protein PilM [Patescibacteria group bacterium]
MGLFSSVDSYLGVDIGSSGIKVVELKKEGRGAKLVSYGFSENSKIKPGLMDDVSYAAQLLNKVCNDAGIHNKAAVAALPTYAVFSSILSLSNVANKDMASAVHWEAKKVIPLPLEEMILDWKVIEEPEKKDNKNIKVLLTGAPKTLVKKYVEIFKVAQMNLLSLETETFSLIRSLMGHDKSTVMIVEIGDSTSDITIADNGIPSFSRSVEVGGLTITQEISEKGSMELEMAEQFKYDLGISSIKNEDATIPKVIEDVISPVVNEIKYAINLYQNKDNKKVEKIILSGGGALLVNLSNYLSKVLDIKVIIGDPWDRISYQEELKPLLGEVGPKLAVAAGLALRSIY